MKFRRQQQIGPYIADFYCPAAKLVVELDGGGHYRTDGIEYDRWRDAYMEGNGLRVLRFTNTQIEKEFCAVCEAIDCAVTPPQSALRADSSPSRGELGQNVDTKNTSLSEKTGFPHK